jgi:uncharacterized iron-regulated protein
MKKRILSILIAFSVMLTLTSMVGDAPAYQFFTAKGKKTGYGDVFKAALEADVVFFGEQHNNPINHWLQLKLTRDLHRELGSRLILGAEMFEADDQVILDEYLQGRIRKNNFKDEAKLWKNYDTDYEPLVEFARENGVPFIATNIPRRYAAVVSKEGFEGLDSLSNLAMAWMAPLPIAYDPELKGYKDMMEMMGQSGHGSPNLPKAQAAKDATMAYFIGKNWEQGQVFVHFNGTYHSDNYEGILWYLKRENPGIKTLTISAQEQPEVEELAEENSGKGDFILCTPEDMTRTH